MQKLTDIPDSELITNSLPLLMDNDKTVASCNEGTVFPTTNLLKGMLCFRSNLPTTSGGLYELVDVATQNWKLIRDFSKTPIHKEEADALYAAIGHNHDAAYATKTHNHDGVYSPVGHNHNGTYSAVGHTHPMSEVTVPATSNAYGTRTVSTAAPTGGSDGDVWYRV